MPLGEKTKLLWQNPDYKEKMRKAHCGKEQSLITRARHSMALSGRRCGSIFFTKGHKTYLLKHTEETKKKISETCKQKNVGSWLPHKTGKEHNNWKGRPKGYYYKKYSKNPEFRIKCRLYAKRAKIFRRSKGYITIQTIRTVYDKNIKKYGILTCIYCFRPIEEKRDSLEHKIPLSRGGDNSLKNLAIACQSCNCTKGNKTEKEFKKERKCIVQNVIMR